MATPIQPIAKCIIKWIYEQISWVLKQLKEFLLWLIGKIDAQIAILRAWLIQWDLIAKAEEFLWNQYERIIDAFINQLSALPEGPGAEVCPEFVEYFTDPVLGLLESLMSSLTPARERFNADISFVDEIDVAISYWTNTKNDLLVAVDVIDDATYQALAREAEAVP